MSCLRRRVRAHGPVLVSVTFGVIWLGLALRSPATTYHLVPAFVAAGWPLAARRLRGRLPRSAALLASGGGLVAAVATTIALAGLDALRGPALVGGSAAAESVLVALAAAAWAVGATVRARPGLVLGMLGEIEPDRRDAGEQETRGNSASTA